MPRLVGRSLPRSACDARTLRFPRRPSHRGLGGGSIYPTVDVLDGTQNYPVFAMFGVLAEDIADGGNGLCVTFGQLDGIDTSGFSVGNALSIDASGQLTPRPPAWLQEAATVITAAASGSIFVLPKRDYNPIHLHVDDSQGGALEAGIEVVLDGGSNPLISGDKLDVELPYRFMPQSVTLLADQIGDAVLDIYYASDLGSFPPTSGGGGIGSGSICFLTLPTLSGAQTYQDTTLSGWIVNLYKGGILRFHLNSVSTVQRITVSLKGVRW